MADEPTQQNPPDTKTDEEYEAAFWEKFDKRFADNIGNWWKEHGLKAPAPPTTEPPKDPPDPKAPGTSRTGGKRPTLRGLFADWTFGPPKE